MKIERQHLADIFKCYSTTAMKIDGELKILFATEDKGPCYSFSKDNWSHQETVWEGPGGTMSIVEIPNKPGEFLAVQQFFPTFFAPESIIIWGKYVDNQWQIHKFMDLPYVHRFDILHVEGINYFVAGTLCTSKKDRDDWSDPGKILVGVLPDNFDQKMELVAIKDQLTRHHGYNRGYWKGEKVGFFTADEGVFILYPPTKKSPQWRLEQLMDRRVSDISVFDLDGDGEDEIVTIEPFHGNQFNINKWNGTEYEVVYQYPFEMDFAHVVWTGLFNGKPTCFGGARRMNKEFFMIRYNQQSNQYETTEIENGGGPSNIFVQSQADGDLILCANREKGEAIVYKVRE